MQNACMSVQITIRDVPDAVKDELAARAALEGKSMQEYLRAELLRIAETPTIASWVQRVRERKADSDAHVSTETILAALKEDRR